MPTNPGGPILNGLPSQVPDIDPEETREWLESLDGLIADVRDHLRPGDLVLFKAAGSVDLVRNVVYPVFGKVV